MSFFQSFEMAFKNILSSKARSLLTMLGIIIGVAAVIVITGLGNGMETYMTDSFKDMGTDLLTVTVMGRGSSRSVSVDDMYQLVADNPEYLSNVSPTVTLNGTVKVGTETLSSTSVTGVSEDYLSMKRYNLTGGRGIEYIDVMNRNNVCVVGSYIDKEWYSGASVGQTIRISGNLFTIVGVLEEKASSEEGDTDDAIYLPYTTAEKMSYMSVNSYTFAMVSEDYSTEAKAIIEDYLFSVFNNSDFYNVFSLSQILDMMSSMISVMVGILTGIAAISLVVGGIGIMNIMLVSVSERTREIGIRKALGAKQRNIMTQFVVEAGTTSAVGGVIGIGFGYVLSSVATTVIAVALQEDMTVAPTTSSVLLAFGISAAIGILFGYLPAKKAARLNPIDALRYD